MQNYTSKNGFTLAEVLITLGIIGVVAALTVPTLVQSYKERTTVAKLKEAFSIISQAQKLAIAENGQPANWNWPEASGKEAHAALANMIKPYLKISVDCVGKSADYTLKHCATGAYYGDPSTSATLKLQNGTVLAFRMISKSCTTVSANAQNIACGQVFVLLEPDNTYLNGQNVFAFFFNNDGILPYGIKDGYYRTSFERACIWPDIGDTGLGYSEGSMYACTAWVIYNGNLDYLRCRDKLSWDGKHSCKE